MCATFLRIFGKNVPHVGRLAAARMIFEEVVSVVSKFLGPAGDFFRIGMRRPLAAPDNHAEVRDLAALNRLQHVVQRAERPNLLGLRQFRGQFYLPLVADASDTGRGDDGAVDHLGRLRSAPNRVGVVIVPFRRLDEVKDVLVHVAQAVAGVVETALDLVPDDAVAERPSLPVRQCYGDAPRNPDQILAGVRVADVQPERARRLEDSFDLGAHGAEVADEIPVVGFESDAAAGVLPLPPIRRARHAAVERIGRELFEDGARVPDDEQRRELPAAQVFVETGARLTFETRAEHFRLEKLLSSSLFGTGFAGPPEDCR